MFYAGFECFKSVGWEYSTKKNLAVVLTGIESKFKVQLFER